jgi:hypothetical protein
MNKDKEPSIPVSALRALLRKPNVEIIELRYLLAALCDEQEKKQIEKNNDE